MSAALCPYCRGPIEPSEPGVVLCPGCGTPHHADCFEENGGCTVFGCSAAPAPEQKLSIGSTELERQVASPPSPPRQSPPPPPPPLPGAASASPRPASSNLDPPPLFSSLGYGRPSPVPYPTPTREAVPVRIADPDAPAKSRTAYMLLGVFFGAFGAHSFYSGYTKKGFIQLGITLLSFGIGGLMMWVWAIIDICTISTDHNGISFHN